MDGNFTIQLRKLLWKMPRDLYINLNDSNLLQRGFESSCGFKMSSRNAWQLGWKWEKAVLSQYICLFVFYSILCEASLPIFLTGTLEKPNTKITSH